MKYLSLVSSLFIVSFIFLTQNSHSKSEELVIYSARKEKFVRPLIEKFEKDTKIKIKLLSGVKVAKIVEESKRPIANIFISNDAGQMEYLRLKGALHGFRAKEVSIIPSTFRSADSSWLGLSARSRVFIYNKGMISEKDMPKNLWDLTKPKYKGKFMITRGGNGSFIAHVAALRNIWGDKKTEKWIRKIKENAGAITHGHTDIRKGVGRGEFAFGLVNNYYFHLQLEEKKHNNVAAIYPDQGNGGMGVFVNAAGVAYINNEKNSKNAQKFLKWVLNKDNQALFSYASKETPLVAGVKTYSKARSINTYKTVEMPLSGLGKNWDSAKALIEKAGLDLVVK
jgi:iron(III) transport system substrate-binding protein